MNQTPSEYEIRKNKVQLLGDYGIQSYIQSFDKVDMIGSLLEDHLAHVVDDDEHPFRDIQDIIDDPIEGVKTAGRLTLFRSHGKLSFGKLMDESGEIQLMFHRDITGIRGTEGAKGEQVAEGEKVMELTNDAGGSMTAYKMMDKLADVGDWIGVEGELFYTHKGELTILVSTFTFLSKAIQPLGDKFHGIGESQERAYRQRYLDMIFNTDSLERMKLRSDFVRVLREFYRSQGFRELDTPILGNSASGAAATPFVTHHADMDQEMYLRIAPEIALKMATVGGLEKVFEIGKNFRNEGSSPSHHQEFLVAEHYAAYRSYEDNMRFTEKMFDNFFDKLPQLSRVVEVADKEGVVREVDFSTPWERVDYIVQVSKDSGLDITDYGPNDADRLRADIQAAGHSREGMDTQSTPTLIDYLYKKVTRPQLVGPAFVYNYPASMQPLARPSDADPSIVEQFQLVVNGREITKAYSELVDPQRQAANFAEQASDDVEATAGDDEFVRAMEYGMPPQSGRGMGLDRILAMLTGQTNIRDVIMFPIMKLESGESDE